MLAIVEALKEYKNFLLGANITIYTDHKNLLSNSTVSDRVFRWKQKIQEFGPILNYIKGHENTEADVLSRLPTDNSTIEVMLNHPPVDPYNLLLNKNPMDLTYIHHHQNQDQALLKALIKDKHFSRRSCGTIPLIHFQINDISAPKIVISQTLQLPTVKWMQSSWPCGHYSIICNLEKEFLVSKDARHDTTICTKV